MKKVKLFIASCVALVCISATANAQHFVVKAGFTSSQQDISSLITETIQLKGANIKDYNSFQIGAGYQTAPFAGITIQPEFVYNQKGSKISDNVSWKISYLQVPVNIQWGIDLIIARPFLQVTPFVGYCVSNTLHKTKGAVDVSSPEIQKILDDITKMPEKLEYGLALGGGIELASRLQLTVKYAWNFGKVASYKEYTSKVGNIGTNKARSLEVTLGYMFKKK